MLTMQDIEIRHLNLRAKNDLSRILESNDSWKSVMASIPDQLDKGASKYSNDDIRAVETAGNPLGETAASIFLDEWGTSGQVRPRLSTLRNLLMELDLLRAADFVSDLLGGTEVERPDSGPAARIKIPETREISQSYPDCSFGTFPPTRNFNALEFENDCTIPCADIDSVVLQEVCPSQPMEIAYDELKRSSGNFSHCLGSGAFGSVYLCKLPSGLAAVKRIHLYSISSSYLSDLHNPQVQLKNELLALTKFKHENLLPLIGYSNDGVEVCLVFNYMPKGSLQDRLEAADGEVLTWSQRLGIAIGAARGLDHLHSAFKPLVHRDVKSANILIDQDFTAKLSDFGLARLGPSKDMSRSFIATGIVAGTNAYMSPEAHRGVLSPRIDVFSFGVVLLEIITGLPVYDLSRTEGEDLLTLVTNSKDDYNSLIDRRPAIPNDDLALEFFKLSELCCETLKERPYINSVLESLEYLQKKFT